MAHQLRHRSKAEAAFERFVLDPAFPCIGGRAALQRGSVTFGEYSRLGDAESSRLLAHDLAQFITREGDPGLPTFVASFAAPLDLSEPEFEALLWSQLERMHQLDQVAWDNRVSADPSSPRFSFSFGGSAFYVVGMHPGSSRTARRSALPMLVFNFHSMFERLRGSGLFDRLRDTIRRRDVLLDGETNPMLGEFGVSSEAREYSGRTVSREWSCPVTFSDTTSRRIST